MAEYEALNDVSRSYDGVSAIVVSYFTGPLLTRCIASLQSQAEISQIIIVDNGNVEGEVERAANQPDGDKVVEILSGHGNIGFAAACNLGAKRASGAFLLYLNPDAVMPAGGVAQLLKDGASLRRPWLMAPKIVNPDGGEQQGSRRAALTPWRAFVEATRLYKIAPRHPYFRRFNLHKESCPDDVTPVSTISGACFFLPKDDFFLVGGMDERYFLHVEDIDLCIRFAKAGGEVYFNPNVEVTHFKSSSRVNSLRVEARKIASITRYFRTHFSDPYPAAFLWLVAGAMWLSFGLLAIRRVAAFGFAILRLTMRRGVNGLKRAWSLAARRSSR